MGSIPEERLSSGVIARMVCSMGFKSFLATGCVGNRALLWGNSRNPLWKPELVETCMRCEVLYHVACREAVGSSVSSWCGCLQQNLPPGACCSYGCDAAQTGHLTLEKCVKRSLSCQGHLHHNCQSLSLDFGGVHQHGCCLSCAKEVHLREPGEGSEEEQAEKEQPLQDPSPPSGPPAPSAPNATSGSPAISEHPLPSGTPSTAEAHYAAVWPFLDAQERATVTKNLFRCARRRTSQSLHLLHDCMCW